MCKIVVYILYFPDQQLPQIRPTFPPIFLRVHAWLATLRHAFKTKKVAFDRVVTDSSAQYAEYAIRGHARVMSSSRDFSAMLFVPSSSFFLVGEAHGSVCTGKHGPSTAKRT